MDDPARPLLRPARRVLPILQYSTIEAARGVLTAGTRKASALTACHGPDHGSSAPQAATRVVPGVGAPYRAALGSRARPSCCPARDGEPGRHEEGRTGAAGLRRALHLPHGPVDCPHRLYGARRRG